MPLLHVGVLCGLDNDDLSGFENAASIFLTLSCTIARIFLSKRRQKECVYASMTISLSFTHDWKKPGEQLEQFWGV